jgi:hypothetical protein
VSLIKRKVLLNYGERTDFEGGLCLTRKEFIQRHTAMEDDGKVNPLMQNQLWSIIVMEKLSTACIGEGFVGRLYRLVAQLIPLGIKIYGKYNELGIIALPPLFQKAGPNLYGI